MTTVAELIDQCSGMLHSYTGTVEASTFLTASIGTADTVLTVAHPTRMLQGIIEIDDELMQVSDQGTTDVTLYPFGRGVNGTTAAAHAINAKVTNDPLVPRKRLFEEMVATVRQCADLFQVETAALTSEVMTNTYELPAACKRVLRVQYETIGPSQEWPSTRLWAVDHNADVTTFPTGKSITINNYIGVPGQPIQITYAADLPVPTATSDDLETLGIPAEMHDLLRFGTCWRAVQMMAPSRLNVRAVEAPETNGVSPNSIKEVAQQFFALFSMRRDEERKRLQLLYPPRPHRVR